MKKPVNDNLLHTIKTSILLTLLTALICNLTGWWVFETWHEILFLYIAINIIVIVSDIKSYTNKRK